MPTNLSDELATAICGTWARARNERNLDLLDTIYDRGLVVHDCSAPDDIVGLESLKAYYAATHEGFPDFQCGFDDVLAARDLVISRWTCAGTHTGVMRNLPPTGRRVRFSGVALSRVEGGLIVEEWVYFNVLDMMQQLGFSLAPAGMPER